MLASKEQINQRAKKILESGSSFGKAKAQKSILSRKERLDGWCRKVKGNL
jgi:hypothetical protein